MGPTSKVSPVHKRHRNSELASPTGSTGAVQIGLLILGNRIVDDVRHIVNVNTSCRNFSSDQDILFAGAEGSHGLLPGNLSHVSVQRSGVETTIDEFLGELRA